MTSEELENIVSRHEMQRLELKESFGAECIETACAFTNSQGVVTRKVARKVTRKATRRYLNFSKPIQVRRLRKCKSSQGFLQAGSEKFCTG